MRDSFSRRASWLTYMGIIPFWITVAAIFLGFGQENAACVLKSYGAVIVSFISGIHWAVGMKDNQRQTAWLLTTSNIIALAAWVSLLIHSITVTLLTQSFCLISLLIIDNKLFEMRCIDFWFIHLRRRATLLVLASIIVSGVMLS